MDRFVIVWEERPDAWTKIVFVKAVPLLGTAALGVLVIHKILPALVANILVLGLCKLPVGDNAESDRVHPKALLPETIRVLEPFNHIPILKAGAPLVIFNLSLIHI